jgi:hypothetical protein
MSVTSKGPSGFPGLAVKLKKELNLYSEQPTKAIPSLINKSRRSEKSNSVQVDL